MTAKPGRCIIGPMTLSVVLPCYNEEKNIASAVKDVASWMQASAITGEIIVVDDGSSDGSRAILDALKADHPTLKVVRHETNQGYGVAVRSGCDAATMEYISFMDSDGQFKARDFDLLLPHLASFAFVTGRRRKRADSFVRNTYGKVLGLFNCAVFGLWVRDVNCAMKVFRREIWPRIRPEHGVEKLFNTEVFLNLKRAHIPWHQVDVPHYPRTAGNPTGGSFKVILRLFKEMLALKRASNKRPVAAVA